MTSSLRSTLTFEPYIEHNWWVAFEGFDVRNSGGSIGLDFPALSVEENVASIEYDALYVANNFKVEFPRNISYLGDITITFYDDGKRPLLLERLLLVWIDEVHSHNTINSPQDVAKEITIYRSSRTDSKVHSKYKVLPPRNLDSNQTREVKVYNNTITLPIVQVLQLYEE